MALYMTYTCAKPHFFKYSPSLYTFTVSLSLSYFSTSPVSLLWFLAPFFSGFPAFFFFGFPTRFFSGFPAVLSYFSRLLFLLFGFFLSKFGSFHVSNDFFLLWVSCTVLLWVSCGSLLFLHSLLFLQVILSSFWVFLIKVSFFSCF